jgi:archaeosine-15-forming tRNA-guanine transglycosylase
LLIPPLQHKPDGSDAGLGNATPDQVEMGELRHARERERAERYRGVYTNLDLRVVAHKDGTLELTWRAGKGVSEVCASPKCTASATTLLS